MCLINLSDVLDHGKMVGIVCMEDGCHCYLSGFLIHILWSFAKGIGGWLVADFKPWAGTKKNTALSYWMYVWECWKIIPPKKKNILRSLSSREFWTSIHICCFFPLCFFWCEFPAIAMKFNADLSVRPLFPAVSWVSRTVWRSACSPGVTCHCMWWPVDVEIPPKMG